MLRSTTARAVVPVAAGLGFFAVMAVALWGVAALISGDSESVTELLAADTYEMGRATMIADAIVEQGPLVLQDLVGDDSHIVLSWTPDSGFAIHLAHPADRPPTCAVRVVSPTALVDCEGRSLTPDDLALPASGVRPLVGADGLLTLDLG